MIEYQVDESDPVIGLIELTPGMLLSSEIVAEVLNNLFLSKRWPIGLRCPITVQPNSTPNL